MFKLLVALALLLAASLGATPAQSAVVAAGGDNEVLDNPGRSLSALTSLFGTPNDADDAALADDASAGRDLLTYKEPKKYDTGDFCKHFKKLYYKKKYGKGHHYYKKYYLYKKRSYYHFYKKFCKHDYYYYD